MASVFDRLKERKLFQWALAYMAGAWVVFEVGDAVGGRWQLPDVLFQGLSVLLAIGFVVTLILAWYHGEKGRQTVSGPELLMIGLLLAIGGGVISMLGPAGRTVSIDPDPSSGKVEGDLAILSRLPGLAVLPLANRSGLAEDQYFADGIHDDLLTLLQRLPGLRVVSRTSTEAYRDTDKTVTAIGRELRVDYVLEGGVQRGGDRVRINLQLIDAHEDVHLWADSYDRALTPESLLEVQSDVVRNVTRELDVVLREEDLQRTARRMTRDPEAYDLFIRGREARNRGEPREAAELQERAVAEDPGFLAAFAEAAQVHALVYQAERTPERAEAARRAAERAAELDPGAEDAQLAMGFYLYRVEGDYPAALDWLGRAAGSLRGDAGYRAGTALVERRVGRWRSALASFEAAATLSPGNHIYARELGGTLLRMRRYAEAETWLQECVSTAPDPDTCQYLLGLLSWMRDGSPDEWRALEDAYSRWQLDMSRGDFRSALATLDDSETPHVTLAVWYPGELLAAWVYEALGDSARALESYTAAASILELQIAEGPADERHHQALGLAYAGLGRRTDALRESIAAVDRRPVERDALLGPVHLFALAAVHARLGNTEEALTALEQLLTIPSTFSATQLRSHFLLAPLQPDTGFLGLLDREPGRVF
jgi:TolB-like protein/Tfp pilus assembly protein PilF